MYSQTLKLSDKQAAQIETQRVAQLRAALQAVDERNKMMFRWDDQLRGDPYWHGMSPRWRGASISDDNLARQYHIMVLANGMSIIRATDWYEANPTDPKDDAVAAGLEAWANDQVSEYDLAAQIAYDIWYNAGRHTYGILYCGWKQETNPRFITLYRPKGSKDEDWVEDQHRDAEVEYEDREEVTEELVCEGFDFRVMHGTDWGCSPPNSSAQDAEFTWERIWYTCHDLLDGVVENGWDEEVVAKIVKGYAGAKASEETYKGQRDSADGISAHDGDAFECFCIYGRPPVTLDENGKPNLKEQDRRRDYHMMIHLDSGKVFHHVPSPFDARPYVKFPFLNEPGREIGDGVCSLVQDYHSTATYQLRWRLDSCDLNMNPPLLVPDPLFDDFQRFKFYPGGGFPVPEGFAGAIAPIATDKSFFQAALQNEMDSRNSAASLFSAQARGAEQRSPDLGTASKTDSQIMSEMAGADEKFDLFLMNWQVGVKQLFRVMISHVRKFAPESLQKYIGPMPIPPPEQLERRFRIHATGSTAAANPARRYHNAELLMQFVLTNPLVQRAMSQGDFTAMYSASAKFLRTIDQRDPRAIMGNEPQKPPEPGVLLQQLMVILQQRAQAGDQGAAQTLAQFQAMLAQFQQSGGQSAAPPAGPPPPKISINFKDLPAVDQNAAVQMAGLPPFMKNGNGNGAQPQMTGIGG